MTIMYETKPDFISEVTKESYMDELARGLESLLKSARSEMEELTTNHSHNVGVAQRLSYFWTTYGRLIQRLIEVRSLSDEDYTFFQNLKDGQFGFKGKGMSWASAGGDCCAPQGKPITDHPSMPSGHYL
ncbi:hypothetical protein LCGC14_2545050 [marine sediment metagenome]|uniref:Uncharacterized protein n=1 Tax=marine sediment metagenome TaxID=412755 RepID=A0A0F9D136_9ZZZZ